MPELPESIVASGPREYDVARYHVSQPSPTESSRTRDLIGRWLIRACSGHHFRLGWVGQQISEQVAVAFDRVTGMNRDGPAESWPVPGEGVEFPVLPAGIGGRGQVQQQSVIEGPAREAGRQSPPVDFS